MVASFGFGRSKKKRVKPGDLFVTNQKTGAGRYREWKAHRGRPSRNPSNGGVGTVMAVDEAAARERAIAQFNLTGEQVKRLVLGRRR